MQNYLIILLATGVGAGFASGLLGIGGGFVMVPVMYWVIVAMGVPEATAIMTAFGTSLLVVLPTAISGAWRHSRRKAVCWRAALIVGPCGLAGGLVGSTLAAHVPGACVEDGLWGPGPRHGHMDGLGRNATIGEAGGRVKRQSLGIRSSGLSRRNNKWTNWSRWRCIVGSSASIGT